MSARDPRIGAYIALAIEAKRPETRERRLAQTIPQLAEGRSRYWKDAPH